VRQALGQAISINPNFFQYHSAAGTALLAEGKVATAAQSFQRAIQLNPLDSWSQWMLASLCTFQGNAQAAPNYYAAAIQMQPTLPSPQQFLQQAQNWRAPAEATDHGDKASQKDWLELISKGLTLANTLAGFFPQGGGGGGPIKAC